MALGVVVGGRLARERGPELAAWEKQGRTLGLQRAVVAPGAKRFAEGKIPIKAPEEQLIKREENKDEKTEEEDHRI